MVEVSCLYASLIDSLTNKNNSKKKYIYKSPTNNFHKNSKTSIQEKQYVFTQNKNALKIGS